MTRDEIAKMAHEAGLANVRMSAGLESMRTDMWVRFAALVAAAEREACAKRQRIGLTHLTEMPQRLCVSCASEPEINPRGSEIVRR